MAKEVVSASYLQQQYIKIRDQRRQRISELEIGQLYAYGNRRVVVMFLGIEQNPILKPACVKILLNEKIHLVYPEAMYDL